MSADLRAHFEQRFSHDFSRVRVHTDSRADASARGLEARAFTTGHDIAFRRGEYDPYSLAGRRLLAHELTHVVQGDASGRLARRVSTRGEAGEVEAERVANAVSAGGNAGPIRAASSAIAREPDSKTTTTFEFEIDPGAPPGQIWMHVSGPTDDAKWVERTIIGAGYNIYLGGFMLYIKGMTLGEKGILVPESDIDFITERAAAVDKVIHNSRAEARAAVAAAPKPADGSLPFAYYWGAGGLVVMPTTICPGTAPKTIATMWQARVDYANFVQAALVNLAEGMIIGKVLGGAYSWAKGGGGGGGGLKPPKVASPKVTTPKVAAPVVEAPVVKTPVVEAPVVKTPVVETPVAKAPVVETPKVAPKVEAPKVAAPEVETPKVSPKVGEGAAPQSGPELFKQTAKVPGGQAEKAKYFETEAVGLKQRTGWEAKYTGTTPDGTRIYHGEAQSKALAITADGRVMTGTWGEHVTLQPGPTGPQLVCKWDLPGWKQW